MLLDGRRRSATQKRLAAAFSLWLLASAASAYGKVTLHVMTSDAVAGEQVLLEVRMSRESQDGAVATMNFDLLFDTTQWNLGGRCENGDGCTLSEQCGDAGPCRFAPASCTLDPRISEHLLEVVPPDFQNVGPNLYRLRFAVVGTQLPIPAISDGAILSCTFPLRADAQVGTQRIQAERLQVADNSIPAVPLDAELMLHLGQILEGTPGPTWTPTVTGTRPTSTPTPTATVTETPTEITETPTPSPSLTPPVTPGERTPCPSPRPAPAGPAVYAEDLVLNAQGTATVSVRLVTGQNSVAATQNDLGFGAGIRINARGDGKPDCAVNPSLNKNGSAFAFLPPGCSGEGCQAVRAVVISLENTDPIPDGSLLYTCSATVSADESAVTVSNVILSDPNGQRIPAAGARDGAVCVEPSAPTATHTPTATGSPVPPSFTPTRTVGTPPTSTPTILTPTITVPPPTTPRATATATSTGPRATVTATPTSRAGGEGDGCDCNISGSGRRGWSSAWLGLPALGLWWWRRRKTL